MIRRLGPTGLQELAAACARRPRRLYPLVFRTASWRKFATYGASLLAWMESQGLRAPGTNPLASTRCTEAKRSAEQLMILPRLYAKMLGYPRLTPKERALLYLLANGLHVSEARHLRISDLELAQGRAWVSSRHHRRCIRLLGWTVDALSVWLERRQGGTSEWAFPGRKQDHPMSPDAVERVVRRVSKRVFPTAAEAHVVRLIRPSGFRRFFAVVATEREVHFKVLMDALGVRTYAGLMHLAAGASSNGERAFRKVARRRPF